jgi:hypothetical protein
MTKQMVNGLRPFSQGGWLGENSKHLLILFNATLVEQRQECFERSLPLSG